MNCPKCSRENPNGLNFCTGCGAALVAATAATSPGIGFSPRINDPAFSKYLKSSNRWAAIFSIILAIAAVVGFTIAGEKSQDMSNPNSFFIGIVIGGMFLAIAFFQIMGKRFSKTWDGVVIDKTIQNKTKRSNRGSDGSYAMERYTVYTVHLRSDDSKMHTIRSENNRTKFDYYQIGDRIRHHGGLRTYEKYDKTRDEVNFCNACSTLNNIQDEYCFRCKCPLLK
jgi:hypothetical protein